MDESEMRQGTWDRLKSLHILRRKGFVVLLAGELLLLALGIAGLFGKHTVYEYGPGDMQTVFGAYSEAQDGWYADPSMALTGNLLNFPDISLPKGFYKVQLHYETNVDYVNYVSVNSANMGFRGCYTNGESLHAGLSSTDFGMWVMRDAQGLIVQVQYEQGALLVTGMTITGSNAMARMCLFGLLCAVLLADLIYLFAAYDRKYGVARETKNVIFGLLLITAFASYPLMTDYIVSSGDVGYHLMRIEGLKDGILSGQFPVRIAPRWLEDNGYASAVFYGEIMLLPAALLRMIGFTVTDSYRMFMVYINFLTAVVAYHAFSKMFRSRYAGLFCSMLYTLSVYRIFKTYTAGSLGEIFGNMFLPLVVYGFYRVFTEDTKGKGYRWSFLPLAAGFAGIIQSHLLTGEMAGGFTILLCVLLWKKVFRRETFLALSKAVIGFVMLSLWFLVPFADYMLTGDFVIQHVSARTIQDRGMSLAQLFSSFSFAGSNTILGESGLVDAAPMGTGFALLVVLLIWLYVLFLGKKEYLRDGLLHRHEIVMGQIAAAFAVLAMVMTLSAFPWNWIQSVGQLPAVLVSSIQFPNRFLTIATVLLVTVAGLLFVWCERSGRAALRYGYMILLISLTIISSLFTINDELNKADFYRIYNAAGMNYGYIAGEEYLPYGTDRSRLVYHAPSSSENVLIRDVEKGSLRYNTLCLNDSGEEGFLQLPLLYYKGYRSFDSASGQPLECYDGENHFVSVRIPAGYEGTVVTRFVSPWYWRAAEIISLLSFIVFCLLVRRAGVVRPE